MAKALYVVGMTLDSKTQLFAELREFPVYGVKLEMGPRKYATAMPRAIAQASAAVLCHTRPEHSGKVFIEEAQ